MDSSQNEIPSDSNSQSSSRDRDSSRDYSESSIISSDTEFGPERSQPIPNKDGLALDTLSLAWVPTFKERADKLISRLLDDSIKFCASGKLKIPPIMSISLLKVAI